MPGEWASGGASLCPDCAGLMRWFLDRFDDAEFQVPKEAYLTPERTFLDMGVDSLDTVELVMEVEEHFDVSLTDREAEEIRTVADLLRHIRRHAKKGRGRKGDGRDPLWDRDLDG